MGVAAAVVACAAAAAVYLVVRRRRRRAVIIKFHTMSGDMLVYSFRNNIDMEVRVMDVDGAYQSATFVDDRYVYDLVFKYHRMYNHVFDAGIPIHDTLMIGGGGYGYPKNLISQHPEVRMDVVELDPMVTSIAHRYFYLDRLIEEFDLDQTHRLETFNEDGREYLERTEKRYDAIFNDCFFGRTPVMSLATVECSQLVHDRLVPGGVYMANVISSVQGEESSLLRSIVATLQQVFAHVHVIPCKGWDLEARDNNVVVATDGDYVFGKAIDVDPGDAQVFHDESSEMYAELFKVVDDQ